MLGMANGDDRTSQNIPSDRTVICIKTACAEAGISSRTMRRLRNAGRGPRIIQVSDRRIGIRRSDLAAWLESRERDATG